MYIAPDSHAFRSVALLPVSPLLCGFMAGQQGEVD